MASTDTILLIYISKCPSFFLFSLFFSHILHPDPSFSSPFSSQSFLTPTLVYSSPFLFRKEQTSQISFKHGIKRCNKTRHKPSDRGWTSKRQPSRRKRAPRTDKRVRESPCSRCQESHKNIKSHHNIYAEDLDQTYRLYDCQFNFCESP